MAITDPRDIPGLVAWYSAEAETGYADGAAMTQWTDLSGNGNHAVPAADGAPTWSATGGAAGGPAISFPGGSGAPHLVLPNILAGAAAGEAMVTVNALSTTSCLWMLGAAEGASSFYPHSNGNVYEQFGGATAGTSFTPTLSVLAWRRYNVWAAPNDWAARLDGVVQKTITTLAVGWHATPQLGAKSVSSLHGLMGCVVFYNRKLTTVERDDLDAWLAANPEGGTPAPAGPVAPHEFHISDGVAWYELETPTGSQAKADAAEQAAKDYADTLGGGAASLDSLSDVDTTTVAPTTGQTLVWDGAQWEPGTINSATPSTLDSLSDVNTTTVAPTDGQTLVYNAAASTWEPGTISGGGGGPAVGEWEYAVTATFSSPIPKETDLQAAPITLGVDKPGTPTIAFTVATDDVVTCDDPKMGFQTRLSVFVAIDASTMTSGTATSWEVWVDGVQVAKSSDAGVASTEWHGLTLPVPNAQVGQNVQVYLWGTVGAKVKWWGSRPYPTRAGTGGAEPGGAYLYAQISTVATYGQWTPATVLAKPWSMNGLDYDTYHNSTYSNGNIWPPATVPGAEFGLFVLEQTENDSPQGYGLDSSTAVTLAQDVSPRIIKFNRLAIPAMLVTP